MENFSAELRERVLAGMVIPACPLALNKRRKLDERRQRALFRYYFDAGAGGLAVGVHTTQFEIRKAEHGLFKPLLQIGQEEFNRSGKNLFRVAGIWGETKQAVQEAELAKSLGWQAGLLSLSAMAKAREEELIAHCRRVSEAIPLIGFYLQPAVGGLALPYSFWRQFAEIPNVVAIKVAPFNRYQTVDVVRALADSGRTDIALYTGNDDNIVMDLVTPFRFKTKQGVVTRRFTGGLLGHWAVWTKRAVELLEKCKAEGISEELARLSVAVTDSNAAFFDSANGYAGCIAGLHEVLRRQGLLEGIWCLNPNENLSAGQAEEISRVYAAYPELNDDQFVAENRERWLAG